MKIHVCQENIKKAIGNSQVKFLDEFLAKNLKEPNLKLQKNEIIIDIYVDALL